jgi:hypothetical protein
MSEYVQVSREGIGRNHAAATTKSASSVSCEEQIRRYRAQRYRSVQPPRVHDTHRDSDKYAARLLQFAQTWAPFGGAPEEETFVLFGISNERFVKRLWQVVSKVGCDPEAMRLFTQAFGPPPRR